jgi:transmembrane sensor
MISRGFVKLLKRYQNGTLPSSVKEILDIWYSAVGDEAVEVNNKTEIKDRIWHKISDKLEGGKEEPVTIKRPGGRLFYLVKVAAMLLVILGIALYAGSDRWASEKATTEKAKVSGGNWVEEVNKTDLPVHLLLPDGSKVTLESGSKLRFPKDFAPEVRKVYLEGSGFFDVTKNPSRPFLVYAGSVLTRVLGTSFRIKSIPYTGGTEVSVVTGKVTVEKVGTGEISKQGQRENKVVLTPNKKVTFFNDSEHYITGLVENPVLVSHPEVYARPEAFNFDDARLADVVEILEKAYGVDITLSNDAMLDCPITADLSADNLYEKMEIIGAVLNARYEITGSSILLTGGGCINTKINPKP